MNINISYFTNNTYNTVFLAYEKTFVMIKPDAFDRKLDSTILNEVDKSGLSILKEWEGIPDKYKIEENYKKYKHKSFFEDWIKFMTSNKIKALILGGDDAISKALNLKRKIRAQYAPNEKRYNLVHSSDDTESAKREIENFFDVNA